MTDLIGGNGEEGSNSYNTFKALFPNDEYAYENAGDFNTLIQNLLSGRYAKIVLPVRNNLVGDVVPVKKSLEKFIVGKVELKDEGDYECPINHSLIGSSNSSLDKIEKIYCYPVAAGQCRKVLTELGREEVFHPDTYGSVVDVVNRGLENEAAIGPHEAAIKLGGKVLMDNISDDKNNITSFKVYSVASL